MATPSATRDYLALRRLTVSLESTAAKASRDVMDSTKRVTETAIKKAWSILDAASEKKLPSEYLGQRAISAIQGRSTD